ncbi:MAG: PPi-type phosphoenolpyruvate carboxykinase [Verrucomicrobia subdivision 3 bacterium]|nr:PPi-type phosphoenolpyruvate carboxykinase [Limisphaerales bacterium]MCS1417386.1 PPi-type phosphoenolpyruvate carboxykinase [Limisphaerales bacterium]
MMNQELALGIGVEMPVYPADLTVQYINLKLALMGCPTVDFGGGSKFHEIAGTLLDHQRQRERQLGNYLCAADWRIQQWLDEYIYPVSAPIRLPAQTFVLDRHGLARALSLPVGRDEFHSEIISSYRIRQGVLHNPAKDRRTTKGVFHIAEGGLPIPADKLRVPLKVFANLLQRALDPPDDLLNLPFTDAQADKARCFVSLHLWPLVCPEIPGIMPEKRMEIRFFAPGTLVSNLDFVESIFGNAGDPFLPENDAGLAADHWTGHSGCVILAPHLTAMTKKEAGLPPRSEAGEALKKAGLCWDDPDELYNEGRAFKLCARDEKGVMVTLIADNYFGYCKKEVKTQISYSANLFGLAEEEHAGGTLAFPSYDLGEDFSGHLHVQRSGHSFQEVSENYAELMEIDPRGFGVDKKFGDIIYVPEDVEFDLHRQLVSWVRDGERRELKLLPGRTYIRPSGYKVEMVKPSGNRSWRLVGTVSEGTVCHKPCTVSGGGKSEISKPSTDAVLHGPVFVADIREDFDKVSELMERDYSKRFRDPSKSDHRRILSFERSLGSVIKLLTPSNRDYTDEYNQWLESIPQHVKELVFVVKRYYREEWREDWRSHFTVDIINGKPGNELKCDNRKLVTAYLRVGFAADGLWRTFGLRKDFQPAVKSSLEDDITASVVFSSRCLNFVKSEHKDVSVRIVRNCENRFFQRPDDAIHRGYDKQTEAAMAKSGNFVSNFEPLEQQDARSILEDSIGFAQYTGPMQKLVQAASEDSTPAYFVSSAHPRIVDGKPSKNPRYLQLRPDLLSARENHIAEVGMRFQRRIPMGEAVTIVVDSVVPGRRNNPPDKAAGIRALAVYNPIHYMELPEYLIEVICSMTGKSPSTTGAGSEGALTKGPFNALPPVVDLNATIVSAALTGADAFLTSAGVVGPKARVDHDISLLIPEVWCRMSAAERDPEFLIREGYLAPCEDMEYEGRMLPFSLLGYRITRRFVATFFGRIFSHPHAVFPDEILRPETQDMAVFAEGLDNVIATQRRVAQHYFDDGSVVYACPPLRAVLHIMKDGHFEGKNLHDPEIRRLFDVKTIRESDWYRRRLQSKQAHDMALGQRHVAYLKEFLNKENYADVAERLSIRSRCAAAESHLEFVSSPEYLNQLEGTVGREEIDRFLES